MSGCPLIFEWWVELERAFCLQGKVESTAEESGTLLVKTLRVERDADDDE